MNTKINHKKHEVKNGKPVLEEILNLDVVKKRKGYRYVKRFFRSKLKKALAS